MAQLPPKAPSMTHHYHLYHNWPSSSSSTTTTTSSSSSFHNQKLPSMSNFHINNINNIQAQPSWVDEFLDFSSTRRVAHRRSVSADSIAFLLDDCSNSNHNNNIDNNSIVADANCFERLDDDQLISMFSDDVSMSLHPPPTASSSNPSTPSDQNSNNDDKPTPLDHQQQQHQQHQHQHQHQDQQQPQQPKNEPGEVESSYEFETTTTTTTSNADQIFDPKRVKR